MEKTAGPLPQASNHSGPAANGMRLRTIALAASVVAAATGLSRAHADAVPPADGTSACTAYGGWIDVKTGRSIDRGELFGDLVAKNAVVLLGESHTDADHHYWELQTVA